MTLPWIDTVFDATDSIVNAADDLQSMARAMHRLGLPTGHELSDIAKRLLIDEQAIRQAVAKECGDNTRRAEEATANMVSAMIVGTKLQNPSEVPKS